MSYCRSAALCLAVVAAGSLVAPAPAEPPPELKKLHALFIVDTLAGLGTSVEIDGKRIEHLLIRGIPKDRLDLTVYKGKDASAAKILEYYKTHKVGKDDALFFFYAGHGATDPEKGHFFALQEGNTTPLLRESLRKEMQRSSPGLIVIVTDCCSTRFKLKDLGKGFRPGPADHPMEMDPVLRALFFQHRGVVDITAAGDNSAFGDDQHGGLFTRTLGETLKKGYNTLDKNRDGFVSWTEVFERVQTQTQEAFKEYAKDAQGRGEKVDQKTQKPRAFSLADGGSASGQSLTLVNGGKKPVRYQHRWEGEASWESSTLPADGSKTHTAPPAKPGKETAKLEVKFENGEAATLKVGKNYKYTDDKKTRKVSDE